METATVESGYVKITNSVRYDTVTVSPIARLKQETDVGRQFRTNSVQEKSGNPSLAEAMNPFRVAYIGMTAVFKWDCNHSLFFNSKFSKKLGRVCCLALRNRGSNDTINLVLNQILTFRPVDRLKF